MPTETTFTAKIMVKGRITVPQNERDVLGLDVGDYVQVHLKKISVKETATLPSTATSTTDRKRII